MPFSWRKISHPAHLLLAGILGAIAAAASLPLVWGLDPDQPTRSGPNRLAEASSPYLLLHKDNPVDWYPWGPEAIEKARREDKPIFLSVGYSSCYWCHVMERESFSNPEIAAILNRHFVAIKVDREERPDLDELYMTATQLLTRRGGWPNSVFLTPELEPFFAGTYFPPEDRDGQPGFASVLLSLAQAWKDERPAIEEQAARLLETMTQVMARHHEPAEEVPSAELAERSIRELARRFDEEHGGFGPAPKFPSPGNLLLLLEVASDDPEALEMLRTTLDRMARGGIYDQLGGGFHRYSTDTRWLVPHFEKMLYDNALLLEVHARFYELTGDPQAARIVRETAAFLEREMSDEKGGFWSAIDAETGHREGAFYVWTRAEIEAALGADDAAFLAPILGFDGEAFFEKDHYVLHLPSSYATRAAELGTTRRELVERVAPLRRRLLAERARRPRPLTDDKVLTDWNGLAISALAEAGRILGEEALVERAERAAGFLLAELRAKERPLRHVWRGGEARIEAFSSDYAYLVRGLLALHRATGERRWLDRAAELMDEQIARLAAPEGGFYDAAEREHLLLRGREVFDAAVPAANAVSVLNLLELADLRAEKRWRESAERALRAFSGSLERSPAAAATLSLALLRYHSASGR